MRQPTLPNRKRQQFVRCPVCHAEFHRQIPGQQWCSRNCAQRETRCAGGAPPKRRITEKDGPCERHWRSYGDEPLPTGAEALDDPFGAFLSWFLRIECDRCGKVSMLNEAHTPQRDLLIRAIIRGAPRGGIGQNLRRKRCARRRTA